MLIKVCVGDCNIDDGFDSSDFNLVISKIYNCQTYHIY